MEKNYHVYVLASRSHVLYTGVTSDLMSRVGQHREGKVSSFTAKYRIHRLVYFETFRNARAAIAREKQIKSWTREKRTELIQAANATWIDLASGWFPPYPRKAGPSASLGMTGFGREGKAPQQNKVAAVGTAKSRTLTKTHAET
jgi:putative endonuclease